MAGMENGEDLRVVQVAAGEAHTLALTGTLAFLFSLFQSCLAGCCYMKTGG